MKQVILAAPSRKSLLAVFTPRWSRQVTFATDSRNSMEAVVKRITSPAFWRRGVVIGVALITLLGIQAFNWVQDVDVAMAATISEKRELHPAESWAFDMRERCRHGKSEFADTRVALMFDCDRMVLKEAWEQGKELDRAV